MSQRTGTMRFPFVRGARAESRATRGDCPDVAYGNGLGVTAVRGLICGRTAPHPPTVQIALVEVDPRVSTWWSRTAECLFEADDSLLAHWPRGGGQESG
ncbi:MAG: hypothetical protein K0Q52_1415 [Microbacterium sp.]|nr:hypothetical protein [Microbacterium sp.]